MNKNETCLLLNVDAEQWTKFVGPLSTLCEIHFRKQEGVEYDMVIAQIGGEESFPSIMKKANSLAPRRIFFEPGLIIDPVVCRKSNSVLINENDLVASLKKWIEDNPTQEVEL